MTDKLSTLDVNQSQEIAGLQLCKIEIDEAYAKKWNERMRDFVVLVKDGKLLRDTLYRKGGINFNLNVKTDRYFLLLKYVEAFYDKRIMDMCKDKNGGRDNKHLAGHWCIIDSNGIEKFVANQFDSIYIVKNSPVYSIDKKYYNIETGDLYCESYDTMETEQFLFLQNKYDNDHSKRGVLQISKLDGSFVLIK